MRRVKIERDQTAHREPNEMDARHFKMIEHAQDVAAKIGKSKRTLVIVAGAVTSRIPRCGVKPFAEDRKLIVPVGAITPDAAHEEHQRSAATVIDSDFRRIGHMIGFPLGHRMFPLLFAIDGFTTTLFIRDDSGET